MPRFSEGADHGGSLTWSVMVTCIMAASGGLIFGYDIGISGGVTAMESFLKQFFPHVLTKMAEAQQNEYCMYDDHSLTAFTSSLYIAALAASLAASKVTELIGRQKVMLLGGFLFFAGSATNAAASNITMLIIGRMFLGFGVGFTNQATPVYLAETSPARYRGAFTTAFQFFNGIGVLAANLTNYFASHIPGWGWRLSLGLAAVPAVFIVLGALLITDTPSSLILRGRIDSARAALKQIRGADSDVDAEMKEMMYSVEQAQINNEGAFKRLLRREYRPHLVMALAIPSFMQLTGVIVIAFFAPLLFRTIGFGSDGALIGAVLLGSVNLTSILVSTFTVDRYGRKVLFMIGGIQMIVCQVAVSWILGAQVGRVSDSPMAKAYGLAVLILVCVYAAGFGWSWGPLNWIISGEILPVEIRSAAQGLGQAVAFVLTFIQTQLFLSMMCCMKFGVFAYYAGWVCIMTAFVAFFLPETKGIPLESMSSIWATHWYWRRFVSPELPK
ncbi:Sugar transport protein 5 [Rhynchospora pubera]|uniref:Sugar transport protein 5 n=2 Tax=Rhynchospora pubera TaxID=906938 RepID=A0AAV8FKV9_9POAL|nr:Sugar transport protein 5 [Rhynchospora pubera]